MPWHKGNHSLVLAEILVCHTLPVTSMICEYLQSKLFLDMSLPQRSKMMNDLLTVIYTSICWAQLDITETGARINVVPGVPV